MKHDVVCEPIDIYGDVSEIIYRPNWSECSYTISELIELLENAKERWGNKKICVYDSYENITGKVVGLYLDKGFVHTGSNNETFEIDDTIGIYF